MRKLDFLGLFLIPLTTWGTESIELQDGTKVEGKILSISSESVVMEVQTTPTIRGEKTYPRADVAKIRRASQDDIAFEEVAAVVVPSTADDPAVYDALLEQKRAGIGRKLVGFEVTGKGIARQGHRVFLGGEAVGAVTSGTFSPTFEKALGMAYVPADTEVGTEVEIEVRNRRVSASIVGLPIYSRSK